MKKNDRIELNITAMSSEGVGLGRSDGMAVFVSGTAVGDVVLAHIIKVKSRYAIGKLVQVLKQSEDRKDVDCPAFKSCGGCAFRHITYESELAVKQKTVEDAINRIGGIPLRSQKIIPSPKYAGYRNKAQYPITMGENGISYGFFARHSHRVIQSNNCFLQPRVFEDIMQTIKAWADKNGVIAYNEETKTGLLRHVLIRRGEKTGEIMVVPVINGDKLPNSNELIQMLKEAVGENFKSLCYNINTSDSNVVLGDKNVFVYGNHTIKDVLCGVCLEISPHSFYQVNRDAAELLYKKAAEYIKPEHSVIVDLYCGIGSIGLSLLKLCGSEGRRLYGVEIVPQAVENAKKNAVANGFAECEFICGDASKAALELKVKKISPDVVVLDPPRKGCNAELLNTVAFDFAPERIVYISCDPSTLARDSKILVENGYKLERYTPVDLFPGTAHVETVALFTK